jgi:hypothetical protein
MILLADLERVADRIAPLESSQIFGFLFRPCLQTSLIRMMVSLTVSSLRFSLFATAWVG